MCPKGTLCTLVSCGVTGHLQVSPYDYERLEFILQQLESLEEKNPQGNLEDIVKVLCVLMCAVLHWKLCCTYIIALKGVLYIHYCTVHTLLHWKVCCIYSITLEGVLYIHYDTVLYLL